MELLACVCGGLIELAVGTIVAGGIGLAAHEIKQLWKR